MSIKNNKNKIEPIPGILEITPSDTISEFMEKCNDNFYTISMNGGGPTGKEGIQGSQGVPTKPKVPIHVWKEGEQYSEEEGFKLTLINENELVDNQNYQVGHLIVLENAHVYKLVIDKAKNELTPEYIFTLQSYDPGSVIDGKTAHVHFQYEDESDLTDKNIIKVDKEFIGICSDNSETSPTEQNKYTWIRIKNRDELIPIDKIEIDSLQNSDFVKKMFSKQVTSSAGFIVDSLNTEPENNKNKVIIGGNNIKIINDDGNTSTLITSDDVTSELDTTDRKSHV